MENRETEKEVTPLFTPLSLLHIFKLIPFGKTERMGAPPGYASQTLALRWALTV